MRAMHAGVLAVLAGASLATPGAALNVVDAEFELCVRDVAACATFYRDGLGMREVEPAASGKDAVLEWAGCRLRLRGVPGKPVPPPAGNPMRQMLASNGFRWFSLWYADPDAVVARLTAAGYAEPTKGRNVSFTRDPDGNVVEIMGIPRSAEAETFTWGMAVSDDAAARTFYGGTLGLREFEPWNLPPPVDTKMFLFATGAGRVKFVATPGERPRESEAGPDAPGLRSVTLRVADLKAARAELEGRGASVTGSGGRLSLADPDGNRIYVAAAAARAGARSVSAKPDAPPAATATGTPPASATSGRGSAIWANPANASMIFRQMDRDADGRLTAAEVPRQGLFQALDRDRNGSVTPAEARAYIEARAPQTPAGGTPRATVPAPPSAPGEPQLKAMPDTDAARDAAGRGQLFESIVVPGLTDLHAGMNGVAIADLNRDGRLDILATFSPLRGTGRGWEEGELLRVFLNDGGWTFREHPLTLRDTKFTMDAFGRGQVPALADFNGDGFLDLFVTRHARMSGGRPGAAGVESEGNSLFVTDGAWDVFREVSAAAGLRNELAYNRQPVLADVNRDGWLDAAIGCDNIKNAMGGVPHSRLFVLKPDPSDRSDPSKFPGRFEDIGGTDLVPDFGGFHHDSAKDKAGPDINLRDLDNDGDLDLVQTCHVDVREPLLPYWPGEYRQGVFCWKNLLAETGTLTFEKVTGNGLACEARLRYDRGKQVYVPEGKAPGLPYVAIEDLDNDGLADVVAVGPANPGWAPRAEYVGGRYWRNLGGFRFEERTKAGGLEALEWTFRDWATFFGDPIPEDALVARPGKLPTQPGMDRPAPVDNRPYFADAIPADFNNDGWLDLVVQDRHEGLRIPARAILFMNRGDGTFEPKPTTFSGLDDNGICGEAADLDGDGLLDLVFAADPDNSGLVQSPDRYESKVYWNTGLHGARSNHWLRLRFAGVKDAELIGARVEIAAGNLRQTRWVHTKHSYKSGGALEVHAGLGPHTAADVKVTLPGGRTVSYAGVKTDRHVEADLAGGGIRNVIPANAAVAPSSPTAPTRKETASRKPDIVIFLADDLGFAGTGFSGCPDIPTPHIDSIAKSGVRFTAGYATHPVCSPSRAGLMSGMYQHRFGFEHNSGPERFADPGFGLPRDIPTLAERLKAAGYATGMVGKWHIGFQEGLRPHERGFDVHYGFLSGARSYFPDNPREIDPLIRNGVVATNETEYLTDAFAREAVAFLDRASDAPVFLYVAFNAVHGPMEAADPYLARFSSLTGTRRTHAAMVAAMDDAVGRVMGKLRDLGREENALVFFYSDNGGPTPQTTSSNTPLRGFKGQLYEGGIRVPFAMQWKAVVPGGQTYREMVMGFDCHATALAAAGVSMPADKPLDGVDLAPFVTGKATGVPHDRLFWRSGEKHAARVGDWKLVQERDGGPQLFDLENDIDESTDLAVTKPEKLKELQAAYTEWEKGTQPAKWVRQDGRTAGAGRGEREASGDGRRGIEAAFERADADRDGKLSRTEYPRPDDFDAVDADKDGFATMDEIRARFRSRGTRAAPAPQP